MYGRDHDVARLRDRRNDVLARLAGAKAVTRNRMSTRRRAVIAGATAMAVLGASLASGPGGDVQAAPVGQGFTVTASDLSYILEQIKIAEHHVVTATPEDPCAGLLGTAANQIASPLIGGGLRTVDGSCNNLQPGQELFGAADQVFPRLTKADFRAAEASPPDFFGPGSGTIPSSSSRVNRRWPRTASSVEATASSDPSTSPVKMM